MFSRSGIHIVALISMVLMVMSCNYNKQNSANEETATTGHITIAADESLKPVMEEELKVWDSSYPKGHITIQYLPEAQCFDSLLQKKVKLIITARDLTAAERKSMAVSKLYVRSLPVAEDAIAIAVHPTSQDTIMTTGQLREILLGKFPRKYDVVFGNAQSGIVRYMADSFLKIDSIPNAYAVKTDEAAIDYVRENPKGLGIVGVSQLYDPDDTTGAGAFYKNVKVVGMRNDSTYKFYQPYQYAIAIQQYPFIRKIYFISSESSANALASGFASFLCSERGQLIFKKAWMVPLRVPLEIRDVELTH